MQEKCRRSCAYRNAGQRLIDDSVRSLGDLLRPGLRNVPVVHGSLFLRNPRVERVLQLRCNLRRRGLHSLGTVLVYALNNSYCL